jgi:hypothetical protein
MDIDVKGFSRKKFAELIRKLDRIHISEISLFEAKAKILQNRNEIVLKKFNEGLSILRSDRRVVIHGYTAKHDQNLNNMLSILNDVNIIRSNYNHPSKGDRNTSNGRQDNSQA